MAASVSATMARARASCFAASDAFFSSRCARARLESRDLCGRAMTSTIDVQNHSGGGQTRSGPDCSAIQADHVCRESCSRHA